MKKQRRKFTKEFKLKVILASLKEDQTLNELSQKFEIHPTQISNWKQDFLSKALVTMDTRKVSDMESDHEKDKEKLYAKIGQLQIELDYLKKKLC